MTFEEWDAITPDYGQPGGFINGQGSTMTMPSTRESRMNDWRKSLSNDDILSMVKNSVESRSLLDTVTTTTTKKADGSTSEKEVKSLENGDKMITEYKKGPGEQRAEDIFDYDTRPPELGPQSPLRNMVDLSNIEALTNDGAPGSLLDLENAHSSYGERIGADTYRQRLMDQVHAGYGERTGMSKKDHLLWQAEKAYELDKNLARTAAAAAPRGEDLAESIFNDDIKTPKYTYTSGGLIPADSSFDPTGSGIPTERGEDLAESIFNNDTKAPEYIYTSGGLIPADSPFGPSGSGIPTERGEDLAESIFESTPKSYQYPPKEGQYYDSQGVLRDAIGREVSTLPPVGQDKINQAAMLDKIGSETDNNRLLAIAEGLKEEGLQDNRDEYGITPDTKARGHGGGGVNLEKAQNARMAAAEVVGSHITDQYAGLFEKDVEVEKEVDPDAQATTEEAGEAAVTLTTELEKELKSLEGNPVLQNQAYQKYLREIGYIKPYKEELWEALFSVGAGLMMGQSLRGAVADSFGRAQLLKEKEAAEKKERDKEMLKSMMDNSKYMNPTVFTSLLNQFGIDGYERDMYEAIFTAQKNEKLSEEAAAYGTAEIAAANNSLWDKLKGYGEKDRTGSHGLFFHMMYEIANNPHYEAQGFDIRKDGWKYVVSQAMTDFWAYQDSDEYEKADVKIMFPMTFFNNAMGLVDSDGKNTIILSQDDPELLARVGNAKMIINVQYPERNERMDIEIGIHKEWVTKFAGKGGKYSSNYPLYFADQVATNLLNQ